MIIDNTAGFQFLFNEDIYLLKKDIDNLGTAAIDPIIAMEGPDAIMIPQPVVEKLEEPVVIKKPVIHFDYTGKNQKKFLILCSYVNLIYERHLTALTSTLQRKELTLDDVAILNLANYAGSTVAQLTEYFSPQRLLILGNACLVPGWDNFKLNQLENLNGTKALYTYSFTEMMGDRDKTKAFWEQMKVL